MGRQRENGHAVLWVIGALALSAVAGFGVYRVIKEQRAAAASAATDEPVVVHEPPNIGSDGPGTGDPALGSGSDSPIEPPDAAPPVEVPAGAAIAPEAGKMIGTPSIEGALEA